VHCVKVYCCVHQLVIKEGSVLLMLGVTMKFVVVVSCQCITELNASPN